MIKEQDKLFLRKLYILFGNGFPYFNSTLRRFGFKSEFCDNWTPLNVHLMPEYMEARAGDGVVYQEYENLLYLTEEGIQWIMQD